MSRIVAYLMLAAALCLSGAATAKNATAQRASFKALYQAIESGEVSTQTAAVQDLRGYALYPYLQFALVRQDLSKQAPDVDAEVRQFLDHYAYLAPAPALHLQWLESLARRSQWQQFLDVYVPTRNATLRCDHAVALMSLGRTDNLRKEALSLWNVGRSQPNVCNAVFAWLETHGALTDKVITRRLRLALRYGHYGLADYLANLLPTAEKDKFGQIIDLYRNPKRALQRAAGDQRSNLPVSAVLVAFKGLATNDPETADKLLPALAANYHFSPAQRQEAEARVGLGYALDHDAKAVEWFKHVDDAHLDHVTRTWRIRAALYQDDWQTALRWLERLPAGERDDPVWRYWHARALKKTGHAAQAHRIFNALARQTGFYAYLAAAHSEKVSFAPQSHTVPTDREEQAKLLALPAFRRAHELFEVDMIHYARSEWAHALSGRPAKAQRQAALLANRWGWHSQSIRSLVRGGAGDDLALRYPTAYRDMVVPQSSALSLRPAWIYGVMRSESLFQPDARSYSGAVGLMQLMPRTARQVARHQGLPPARAADLTDPATNVILGTSYLRRVLDRFNDNVVPATAAYNAGPNRVAGWLPARPVQSDVWVENIPYVETRTYVKRVMGYTAMFEWRLNDHVVSPSRLMPPVQQPPPPAVATTR